MKHIILNVAHLLLRITFFIPVFNLLHIFLDEKVEIGKKLRATVALEEKLRQKKAVQLDWEWNIWILKSARRRLHSNFMHNITAFEC